MGRELKRVPFCFDWPIGVEWPGYNMQPVAATPALLQKFKTLMFRGGARNEGRLSPRINPPSGRGYQLWGTTGNGEPMSPVFRTLDELCEWAEQAKASWFGRQTATAAQWKYSLTHGTAGMVVVKGGPHAAD